MNIVRIEYGHEIGYAEIKGDVVTYLKGDPYSSLLTSKRTLSVDQVKILCPIVPNRIFGVGVNYYATASAWSRPIPERPFLFMKPSTTVIGSGESIIYPRQATNVFFEGELAVVIGKKGRHITEDSALDYVLGFTCGNDLTERNLQLDELKAGCMMLSKGFDTFNPLGPAIVTGLDSTALDIEVKVNGEVRQKGNTADLIFSVAKLISYLSEVITLLPGDVIMTGTPPGLGAVLPGDEIEIEMSGIGVLRNSVILEG